MKKILLYSYSLTAPRFAAAMHNLFTCKNQRLVLFTLLLILGVFQQSIAQTVYYLGSDGSLTNNANDGIYKVNQDGTGLTRICNGVSAPQDMALDLPNNRAFVSSFTPSPNTTATANGIYSINLGTGVATLLVSTNNSFRAANLVYDPVNDYLYYTSNDGNGATTVATDGISRIKGNGTGNTVLASSISPTPTFFGIDIPNNKIYIFESVVTAPKLMTYNLSGNSATLASSFVMPRLNGMDYDPINNWIYYTTDNGNTDLTTDDALWKMRPNGTSQTKIISSLTANPNIVTVERTRNIAFVWNSTAGDRRIVKVDVAAGTQSAFPISPGFNISNQVAAIVIPAASKVATLSAFTISSGTLSPSFGSGTTTYTASVANSVTAITVTPTKTDNFASIKVNGTTVTSGSASGNIALNIGDNVITTVVTAEDGLTTQTYTLTVNRPKAAQTITFGTIAAKTFGNADFPAGASASSGLTLSYTSSNTSVATVSGTNIHIVGAGTSTITASQAGDASYLPATSATQIVAVNKAAQTITFNALAAKPYGNADFTPGASTSSPLALSYTSSNTAVATIVNNQIHIIAPGTTTITASQSGNTNYNAAADVAQNLTINKATVTVNAAAKTKVYGNNDPTFTYTATGVVGTDAPTGELNRVDPTTNKFVGAYAITQGTLSYGDRYNITYVGADLTITKRPLTIKPVGATKVYGDADPGFISFFTEGTTIAPGDATTGNFARSPGENVGAYATLIGEKRVLSTSTYADVTSNYNINFISTNTFVITPKAISLTANAATKAFGDLDPTFTYSIPAEITDATFTGSLSRATGEEIGSYAITTGSLQINSNYTFNLISANLTIGPKTLILTPTAATKVYGNNDPTPTFTTNVAIVGNATFTGALTREEGKNIGTYAFNGLGTVALDNPRYTLSFATGGALTITKRPITLRPQPATKSYGSDDPGYPYQFLNGTSVAPGEGMTGLFGRAQGEAVGTYALTLGAKSPVDGNLGVLTASNYDITFISDNLTITPRRLDITANNLSKSFSDADPILTYSVNQTLVGSDAATGSLARAIGENRGSYPINQGTLSFGNNYQIYFNGGTFTIGKKTIDVTANAFSKTYGAADPTFTYTASSSPVGENFTGTLSRTTGENFGTYPISKGSLSLSDNYIVNFTSADFSINKGLLTYVANPASRPFKTADPTFSGTVTGFVNGETLATATTGTLVFSTLATTDSSIGNYALTGSGLAATNYNFIQDPANLTALSITASNDNTLSAITSSVGTLTPNFSSSQLYYNVSVTNDVKSIDLSATVNSEYAQATLNGTSYPSGSSKTLPLIGGGNNFPIAVTAQDGTIKTYYVNVYRSPSTNNALKSMSLSGVTMVPAFDSSITEYTASVPYSKTETQVYGVPVDSTAVVMPSQAEPITVQLPVGEGYVGVSSKAENGDIRNYRVTIIRAGSPDATLATIGNADLTLNTSFTSSTHTYHTSVAANIENIIFWPEATNSGAVVKVNGIDRNPYAGNQVQLSFGNNNVNISVTSQDGATTLNYTINVIRKRYADAYLVNISIPNNGEINEEFNATRFDYTGNVSDSTYTGLPLKIWRSNSLASVKVNGVSVADPMNYMMALHGGENKFKIEVTSQDSTATNTYNLVVTRAGQAPPALSPNAALYSMSISAGSFSKNFNFAYEQLTPITVANATASVNLFLYSEQAGAKAKVNDVIVPGTNQEYSLSGLNLAVGANLLNIVVTAEDGIATRTYPVEVIRLPYVNVDLASLTINNGTYTPSFSPAVTTYNLTVRNSVTQLIITPVAATNTASISIPGALDVTPQNPTATINLNTVGPPQAIRMTVRAADGVTTKRYTLNVTRLAPSAKLANLVLSSGTISPVFNPDGENFSATVAYGVASITLTPTAEDTNAVIKVNETLVTSGNASSVITLNSSSTVVNLQITSASGAIKEYKLTINKALANIATLTAIALPGISIKEAAGTSDYNYEGSVDPDSTSVRLRPDARHPGATIRVNGTIVASGTYSAPIPLTGTQTTINVSVTAQDGVTTKTYAVTVKKTGSNVATLLAIALPGISIREAAGTSDYNYEGSVDPDSTSVRLRPDARHPGATIRVNGTIVASGTYSAPIPLTGTQTTINVSVTAQDGVTTKTYAVTVKKTGSNVATLLAIALPGISIREAAGTSDYNYEGSVDPDSTSVRLRPDARHPGATIRVNGTIVASGTYSAPIPLTGTQTTINVSVTAQDGVTTKTYAVTVKKTGSNVATLLAIALPGISIREAAGTSDYNYEGSVDPDSTSVRLRPDARHPGATIRVNGTIVASGTYSAPIPLTGTQTAINVSVTAQDGVTTKTYAVTVKKTGSNVASLIAITIPGVAIRETTGTSNFNYEASLSSTTSSITLKLDAKHPGATIKVNGINAYSGIYSAPMVINGAVTTINILVKAQDGITTRTYSIKLTKLGNSTSQSTLTINNLMTTESKASSLVKPEVLLHPALSPNGDGVNDVLKIDGVENYPDNKLSIMNRVGVLIFSKNGYDNHTKVFDGHANDGTMQLPGTYFYTFEYKDGQQTKRKTGYIIIKY